MSETLKLLFVLPIISGLAVGVVVGLGVLVADITHGLNKRWKSKRRRD